MPQTVDKPPCTHREQLPAKECCACGCYLRSYGNEAFCDPCSNSTINFQDTGELVERVASLTDYHRRREAFEALAQMAA